MLNFKGMRFPIYVILVSIRWYVACPLSYRNLREIMEEQGVLVDHWSINIGRDVPIVWYARSNTSTTSSSRTIVPSSG